jgi:hypothetical protein
MRFVPRAVLLSVCLLAGLVLSSCSQTPPTPAAAPAPSAEDAAKAQIERGRVLVVGGGCHDCHSPKVMTPKGPDADLTRALSGHPESAGVPQPFKAPAGSPFTVHTNDHLTAWSGAWGVSFAANLTPDDNTGIGIWTEKMFVDAIKMGKHMGTSRQILPPMPWNWYGQLPEEDLKAMFAYLKSLPAIVNRVPVPLTPDGKPVDDVQ